MDTERNFSNASVFDLIQVLQELKKMRKSLTLVEAELNGALLKITVPI